MRSQQKTILFFILTFLLSVSLFVLSDLRQTFVNHETLQVQTEWLNPITVIWDGYIEQKSADGNVEYSSDYDVVFRMSLLFNLVFILFFFYALVRAFIKSAFNGDWVRLFWMFTFWLSAARLIHFVGFLIIRPLVLANEPMQWEYFSWEVHYINIGLIALSFLGWHSMGRRETSESSFKSLGVPQWNRPFYMMFDRTIIIALVGNTFYIRHYYMALHPSWNRSSEDPSEPNFLFWGWLLSSAILVLVYVIAEKYFGFTPGKLLMGTRVVKEDEPSNISFGSSIARTFSRFIPFENLSILARSPWHDSISKSQLVYEGNSNWFQRQSRMVRNFSIAYLLVVVWMFWIVAKIIYGEIQMDMRGHSYSVNELYHSGYLPMALLVIGSFMFMFLISGWLASVNTHFENVHERNASSRGGMYFEALCMWIPFVHFFLPSRINGNIRANIELNFGESEAETRVYKRSRLWGAFFHVFVIFYWLGLYAGLSYLGHKESMLVGCFLIAFGSLFLTIGTIVYARGLERLELDESMLITQQEAMPTNGTN